MRQLDSEAKKASRNILNALLENAAAKTSTERQIHTDEPAEAPKEEKEALVKRTQKPEVPHKAHIVEGADTAEISTFEIDYAPDNTDLSTEDNVVRSVKEWLGTLANEVRIEVLNLNGPGSGWPEVRLTGDKEKIGQFLANDYEEDIENIYDMYLVECVANRTITAELNEEAQDFDREKDVKTELENQIASLQDALDNTLEMPDDERAEIQAQIDELLDEINYYENEGMFESSLRESENDYTQEEVESWVNELYHLGPIRAYKEVLEQTKNEELADEVATRIEIMHDEARIFDESEKLEEKLNDSEDSNSTERDIIIDLIEEMGTLNFEKFLNKYEITEEEFWDNIDSDGNDLSAIIHDLKYFLNESEVLTEARNPENDEANDLIRKALNNPEFAKTHAQELRKHGIKYIPPKKGQEWRGGALEGKEGRRLATNSDDWHKNRVDKVTDSSYNDVYKDNYSHDDSYADKRDLHQKTYKDSKDNYKYAKSKIEKQAKKVADMEKKDKEAGLKWNEKTSKAKNILQGYKDTIEKGVIANYSDNDKIHPDTDLKGFLNAKKHSDRELPREKDKRYRVNGKIVDPASDSIRRYKDIQTSKRYLDRTREEHKRDNERDEERIKKMQQDYENEKARRDRYERSIQDEIDRLSGDIQDRLAKYRKRMNK